MWSTDLLERLCREIKRRAGVVQAFPSSVALGRLTAAVLAELHSAWQVFGRRCSRRVGYRTGSSACSLAATYLSVASRAELFTDHPTDPLAADPAPGHSQPAPATGATTQRETIG